jgi:hypothetical protein
MNRSQSFNGRTDRHWLSRLLDDAAFPALSLAVAVSQLNIGYQEKDAPRQLRRQSNEVQLDNGFGEGADKYSARAATESSRFKEKTGSEKELTHDQ